MAGNKQRPGNKFGIKSPNANSRVVEKNNLGFVDTGSFSVTQAASFSKFVEENKDFLINYSPLGAVFNYSEAEKKYLVRPVGIFRDSTEQIFLVRQSEILESKYSTFEKILNEIRLHNTENGYFQEIIGNIELEQNYNESNINESRIKVLTRRSFVSVTGREVLASEHSFKLSRAVLAIKNFLKYLDIIHRSGGYHGAVKLSNISFAIESEGLPLDYMLTDTRDILKAQKNDLNFFSTILGSILEDLKTSEHDAEQKGNLVKALSPLLFSLKDDKYKNIPSTSVALDLFNEISSEIINTAEKRPNKLKSKDNHQHIQEIKNIEISVDDFYQSNQNEVDLDFSRIEEVKPNINKSFIKNKVRSYSLSKLILSCLVLLTLFLLYKIYDKYSDSSKSEIAGTSILDSALLTTEELQLAWSSNVPSRMKLVAKQAVYLSPARGLAEEVILASIISNTAKANSSLVDASLLRIAFSKEWEEQLTVDDRRYALAFSLRDLIQQELPNDLGLIQNRHPGVIIAVIASSAGRSGEVLSKIPATILETLPDPFGVAFKILISGNQSATCSSKEVLDFAILSTRGIEDPKILADFLSSDFSRRLAALSVVYSRNEEISAKILDTIIEHPNLAVITEETTWAKKVSLIQWPDISYSDKLFLLSGVPLKGDRALSPEVVARLFLNPAPRVRSYAAGLAVNSIKFKHPAAPEVLALVQKDPNIVTTDQFVILGQILEDPEKTANTHMNLIEAFIASKPPLELIKILLTAESENKEVTILDSILTVYLTEIGWNPSASDLMKLSLHRDKVARMFAYQKIFEFNDKEASKLMLKDAISKEKDPELKKQLTNMISKVS